MVKRSLSNPMRVLGLINEVVVREGRGKDGYYKSATFSYNGVFYIMHKDGSLFKVDKNGDTVPVTVNKGKKVYPEYSFKLNVDGNLVPVRIKAYHLSLLCLTDDFYETFMNDDNLVVNHMYVEEFHREYAGCCVGSRPIKDIDPRFIEVVSYSDNVKIGHLVGRYGLHNMIISASDYNSIVSLIVVCEDSDKDHHKLVRSYCEKIHSKLYKLI